MKSLRQGRWLRSVISRRSASVITTAAVVGAGLLLPGAGATAPHSHARRPLPTALHATTVSDNGPHASGKRQKQTGKGKAGPRSTRASSGPASTRAGKRSKGRKQQAEPADPVIPMYRAHRGAGLLGGGERDSKWTAHAGKHPGRVYGPAPLISSSRHSGHLGSGEAVHNTGHAVYAASHAARPTVVAHRDSPANREARPADSADFKPAPVVAANRPEVFSEGVSHPDDDERLPRDRAVLGEDAPPTTPAPITRVSPAPSPEPKTPVNVSPIVQGFGGEIAVPSSPAADRPSGTRRRSHPSNWQPESMVVPPEPLEEREAITEAAVSPVVLPEIYDRNGRLVMPAPLKGSHDVLVHQNLMANSDGLDRIYDDADLERLRASHLLVSFPLSESLRVNEDLPPNRRVARPWTVAFASDMGRAFYGRFRQPLQVNSAARTVHFQARLQMVNGNAAAISGEAASPHLTGQAIDIGKRGMNMAELAWMRGYLAPLMHAGKIDVEEEFQQSCFHISVYRSYASSRRAEREYAQVHANSTQTIPIVSADERQTH